MQRQFWVRSSDGRPHLRIDDGSFGNWQTQRRARIAYSVVAAFFIHYEADIPPRRRDTEEVRRWHIASVLMIFARMLSLLLQLVGVRDQAVLKVFGGVRCGGGLGKSARGLKPQQDQATKGWGWPHGERLAPLALHFSKICPWGTPWWEGDIRRRNHVVCPPGVQTK